jgi:hypothetical protein
VSHRAVVLDAKAKLVVLLQSNEGGFRHEMFVYRPERAAALDPDISRTQPVTQMSKGRDLVKSPSGKTQPTDSGTAPALPLLTGIEV